MVPAGGSGGVPRFSLPQEWGIKGVEEAINRQPLYIFTIALAGQTSIHLKHPLHGAEVTSGGS